MGGIFGIVTIDRCVNQLYLGTFYQQHRAQQYCGLATYDGKRLHAKTHKGLIRQQFPKNDLATWQGTSGIGALSGDRQPVSMLSKHGGMILCMDGNIINHEELKTGLLQEGATFSEYHNPDTVNDTTLIAKIIARHRFETGVECLVERMQGDFALVALKPEGVYASRGWGRKPLILGKSDNGYAVASESNAFINTGFTIIRDVSPGETVLIDKNGIHTLAQLPLRPVKFGTFEWIYTAYPPSVIDGRHVKTVRKELGRLLAKRFPIDADLVSPVPNSGRWHARGYAEASGLPYDEVFIRFDYSDRSYTQENEKEQQEEGDTKLIPDEAVVRGKRIIIVDDSIVRGTQTRKQSLRLKECGATEVHAVIACPPLMSACKHGKTTKKDDDCIARTMTIEEIRESRGLDSLNYATIDDLEKAIDMSREQLCIECWSR